MRNEGEKTARILRIGRKLSGLSQIEASRTLGISQSLVSKLESGILAPDVALWFAACRLYRLDPEDSFVTGYVDHFFCSKLSEIYPKNKLKVAARWSQNAHVMVRYLLPLLRFAESRYGRNGFERLMFSKKIDPDFFYVLDAQLNIHFLLELFSELSEHMSPTTLAQITRSVSDPELHGVLNELYMTAKDPLELIQKMIANNSAYESEFDCTIEDIKRQALTLSVSPKHYVDGALPYDLQVRKMLCDYKQAFIQQFTAYGHEKKVAELSERECFFKGQKRCLYHLKMAA